MESKSLHLVLGLALLASPTSASVTPHAVGEDIVISARRTGAPVWRVQSNGSTLVLVGSISDVAAGTEWRPGALQETIGRADQVMFPSLVGVTASPFAMIGYKAKWKKQSRLPKGQSLKDLLSAASLQRLERLRSEGLAPPDYHRWHPLHLALKMQGGLRDRTGLAPDVNKVVNSAISKYKVRRLPITNARSKPLANDLFASSPAAHVGCLVDTIAMVEAGEAGLRQRSRDWASQRVQAVLATATERAARSCWPANAEVKPSRDLLRTARQALATNGTTVAVIPVRDLANPEGLLNDLLAAGFSVEGPPWR